MTIRAFYAGQLLHEFPKGYGWSSASTFLNRWSAEIYNGAYLHENPQNDFQHAWYRADLTPVLDVDVPKELKLLVLLLN